MEMGLDMAKGDGGDDNIGGGETHDTHVKSNVW